MAADALAPYVARTSATMVLTTGEEFQLPCRATECWEMLENVNTVKSLI